MGRGEKLTSNPAVVSYTNLTQTDVISVCQKSLYSLSIPTYYFYYLLLF